MWWVEHFHIRFIFRAKYSSVFYAFNHLVVDLLLLHPAEIEHHHPLSVVPVLQISGLAVFEDYAIQGCCAICGQERLSFISRFVPDPIHPTWVYLVGRQYGIRKSLPVPQLYIL